MTSFFEEIKKAKQTEHTSSLVSIIYERKRKRRDNDLLVAKYEANISASRDMMFQSDPAPTLEIPQPISDIVQLAVSAPQVVAPGRSFLLDVWA
jgi:hypothetical protein